MGLLCTKYHRHRLFQINLIIFNNLIKHDFSIQLKNKMKNFAFIGLLLLKDATVCYFVFRYRYQCLQHKRYRSVFGKTVTLKHEKHGKKPNCNV
jgi:hypothetical protein